MKLIDCLNATPTRTLMAIYQTNRWSYASHANKSDLVRLLALRFERFAERIVRELPAQEHAALQILAQRQGSVSLAVFQQRFGPIHPYRPWRSDEPRHEWRRPASTAETLYYRGLIYPLWRDQSQPVRVVLPDEFIDLMQNNDQPAVGELPAISANSARGVSPLDMTLLLAFLEQVDIRPIHGHWLSPSQCLTLGACLSPPLALVGVRSERQATRLAFPHYLTERLRLIALAAGILKPNMHATAFLAQPPATQIRQLWEAWLDPEDENRRLWKRYRLPGHQLRDPIDFARRLLVVLAETTTDGWFAIEDLESRPGGVLLELMPWWEREQASSIADQTRELLVGPLYWLGAIEADKRQSSLSRFRLTPLGKWLVGIKSEPPELNKYAPLKLEKNLALSWSAHPSLEAILRLAQWSELRPGPTLQLTMESVTDRVARGGELADLFAALSRHARPAPTPGQGAMIEQWVNSAHFVSLRPGLLLHSDAPESMETLWSDRSIRSHLGVRLKENLASVRSDDPALLVRALQRRGFTVRVPRRIDAAGTEVVASGSGDASGSWLYLAALLQRRLAFRWGVIAPLPGAVLDSLRAELGAAEADAVEASAAAAFTALEHAVNGPPWLEPAPDQQQTEARLIEAIERAEILQLHYWSPWYGEVSERRVTPSYLEWRGEYRYLVAYCWQSQAERTFRLDRILELRQCDTPSPS